MEKRRFPRRRDDAKDPPPDEVKNLSTQNADADKQALRGAESLRQMMCSPVYGDPLVMEEEFVDLTIRYAQRGLRWVKMAKAVGVSVTNRSFRAELRARQ